ncbi:hypothetical protein BMS_2812 [Halobacteriovorax marinus SJ]|uniref:Uncharacterized protein n=1 Tax=Halobacteriovorax marinus (strain ATCC BAA-682 / DSM 15412 / SJ) TaxID=862908 RepID=E1WY33_HALMS|nr:hypothetical protein BMS_2812 [Halobacteriovorax marinus SJ]
MKLIKFILSTSESSGELIKEIHTELNTLQRLRGRGKAHGNWQVPDGSLIEDAENRLIRVINALTKLKEHLEKIN